MTLVDTRERISASLRATLADVGVDVSDDDIWPFSGPPLADTLRALAPGHDAEPLVAAYRARHDAADAPAVPALPGAVEALAAVREHGGRTLVVSAKITHAVEQVLAQSGLSDGVDAVVGGLFGVEKGVALTGAGATVYVGDVPRVVADVDGRSGPGERHALLHAEQATHDGVDPVRKTRLREHLLDRVGDLGADDEGAAAVLADGGQRLDRPRQGGNRGGVGRVVPGAVGGDQRLGVVPRRERTQGVGERWPDERPDVVVTHVDPDVGQRRAQAGADALSRVDERHVEVESHDQGFRWHERQGRWPRSRGRYRRH